MGTRTLRRARRCGGSVDAIGKAMGKDPRDAAIDLVIADKAESSVIISIMRESDVVEVGESALKAPNLSEALCDGEFDAFVITVGHPSPLIKDASSMCDVVLVPVAGPPVEDLIATESLYAASSVPASSRSAISFSRAWVMNSSAVA